MFDSEIKAVETSPSHTFKNTPRDQPDIIRKKDPKVRKEPQPEIRKQTPSLSIVVLVSIKYFLVRKRFCKYVQTFLDECN